MVQNLKQIFGIYRETLLLFLYCYYCLFVLILSPISRKHCCLQLKLLNTIQSAFAKLMQICKKVNWKCNSNCLLSLTSHHFILYCNTNAKQMKICCKISKKAIKLDWECNSNVLCHEWWIQRSEWIKSFQNFCLDLISGRRNHEAISRKQYSQHHNFSKSQ